MTQIAGKPPKPMYGSRYFFSDDPQQRMFDSAAEKGHLFFIGKEYINPHDGRTVRCYASYKNAGVFWAVIKKVKPEDRTFYELIREDIDQPFRVYLDFDRAVFSQTAETDAEIDANKTEIVGAMIEAAKTLGVPCTKDDIVILNDSREKKDAGYKYSFHFNYKNLFVKTMDQAIQMAAFIASKAPTGGQYIDPAVYTKNRNWRLSLCHKANSVHKEGLVVETKHTWIDSVITSVFSLNDGHVVIENKELEKLNMPFFSPDAARRRVSDGSCLTSESTVFSSPAESPTSPKDRSLAETAFAAALRRVGYAGKDGAAKYKAKPRNEPVTASEKERCDFLTEFVLKKKLRDRNSEIYRKHTKSQYWGRLKPGCVKRTCPWNNDHLREFCISVDKNGTVWYNCMPTNKSCSGKRKIVAQLESGWDSSDFMGE